MFHGRHMRGLAREKEKADDVGKTLWRLLAYFKPYIGLVALVGVLVVFGSLIEVVSPYLIGVAVDQFIDPKDIDRPAWMAWFLPQSVTPATGLNRVMLALLKRLSSDGPGQSQKALAAMGSVICSIRSLLNSL